MKGNEKIGELSTILGKGSVFEGKLNVEHTLRVDGKFTGDISTTDTLIIYNISHNAPSLINVAAKLISGSTTSVWSTNPCLIISTAWSCLASSPNSSMLS